MVGNPLCSVLLYPAISPSLCQSCFIYQIRLAHSKPPPPADSEPPCFDPADHSVPPSALSIPLPSAPPQDPPPRDVSLPSGDHSSSELDPDSPGLPPPPHTCSCTGQRAPQDPPALLLPLQEVAGAEGIVRVHISFSLSDLSPTEKRLGSFSTNPDTYLKEFRYLTQSYDLT